MLTREDDLIWLQVTRKQPRLYRAFATAAEQSAWYDSQTMLAAERQKADLRDALRRLHLDGYSGGALYLHGGT